MLTHKTQGIAIALQLDLPWSMFGESYSALWFEKGFQRIQQKYDLSMSNDFYPEQGARWLWLWSADDVKEILATMQANYPPSSDPADTEKK